jgi:hypothetical protein
MRYDRSSVRNLYKKLLALYPKGFKQQLGESMEQTFNDLYIEHRRQNERGLSGYVLWIFAETIMGIVKEHVSLIQQGDAMKTVLTNLKSPAIISLVLVFPFVILELVNRRDFHEGFPVILFAVMWLLPVIFILILMPVVRSVRAGKGILANPIVTLLRVAFLVLIAIAWTGAVIDQLPCFLGVPLCD